MSATLVIFANRRQLNPVYFHCYMKCIYVLVKGRFKNFKIVRWKNRVHETKAIDKPQKLLEAAGKHHLNFCSSEAILN